MGLNIRLIIIIAIITSVTLLIGVITCWVYWAIKRRQGHRDQKYCSEEEKNWDDENPLKQNLNIQAIDNESKEYL